MIEYISEDKIKDELKNQKHLKPSLYANRKIPLEYLSDRDFEIIVYYLYKSKISNGKIPFDEILLMKGTKDLGRDCILLNDGKNNGIIQCKRYSEPITKPSFVREIIKFLLHSFNKPELIHNSSNFKYYYIALKGINDTALDLYQDFKNRIEKENKISNWIQEVLENNKSFKNLQFEEIKKPILNLLKSIDIKLVTEQDLSLNLKVETNILKSFFEVEKVLDKDSFREILKEFNVKSINDDDVKRLVDRIEDIPNDQRMILGLISFFGFNEEFLKKIIDNNKFRELLDFIVGFKSTINEEFMNFIQEKIEDYHYVYFAKNTKISAFTKQAIVPYLLSICMKRYMQNEMGDFFSNVVNNNMTFPLLDDLEVLKNKLINDGEKFINGDYSDIVGDVELKKIKMELLNFIYKDFETKEQLKNTIDRELKEIKPYLDDIENQLIKYIPKNTTIVIENMNFLDDDKLVKKMISEGKRFDN